MSDTITPITMWPDSQGTPWTTEDAAVLSNSRIDLTAFLDGQAESGTVAGLTGANTAQLANAILGAYTLTPIAPAPAPAPAP